MYHNISCLGSANEKSTHQLTQYSCRFCFSGLVLTAASRQCIRYGCVSVFGLLVCLGKSSCCKVEMYPVISAPFPQSCGWINTATLLLLVILMEIRGCDAQLTSSQDSKENGLTTRCKGHVGFVGGTVNNMYRLIMGYSLLKCRAKY